MFDWVACADIYFANHFLCRDVWRSISSADMKQSLLATAVGDINTYLGGTIDSSCMKQQPPFTAYQKAVFEWAVFLYQNKNAIMRNVSERANGVSSIDIDGIGKEVKSATGAKYRDTYSDMIARSPAARYLSAIYIDTRIVR